jgi:hypothetical protein
VRASYRVIDPIILDTPRFCCEALEPAREYRDRFPGRHIVTIVCGSNVDVDAYHPRVGPAPARLP